MKPDELIPLSSLPPCKSGMSRRGFCTAAGVGLVTLGAAACAGGGDHVEVGALDDDGTPTGGGGGTQTAPDAATGGVVGSRPDLATRSDLASGGGGGGGGTVVGTGCPAGGLNAGPASAIAVNSAKNLVDNVNYNYNVFVCHDSGGYYAIDGWCTHEGCGLSLRTGPRFYCRCHGAYFDYNGQNPTHPAPYPLVHYAVCQDSAGNLIVDTSKTVSVTTRL
jgi:nitrite reductase/ring-hydroxylating ferredoxin subunit